MSSCPGHQESTAIRCSPARLVQLEGEPRLRTQRLRSPQVGSMGGFIGEELNLDGLVGLVRLFDFG